MDFGIVGFDGLGGSQTGFAANQSDQETKNKWYGSGLQKQGRSADPAEQEDWRSSKMAKNGDFSASKTMQQQQQQQLLSFSNSGNSEGGLVEKSSQNPTLPYIHQALSAYNRTAGHNSGSFNGATMHWSIAGTRGPFTPSQWMELEHQALIYKYITANVPIPSNLLIPIKKALDCAGFSAFPNGLLRPNTLGWGSIHLGFSNNDPEPGRCRRTDGKKWRCWRDAVPDQKYCERHMNRGRHRSRKPVEGTTTAANTSKKHLPLASSSLTPSVSMPGGGGSNVAVSNQQLKNLQQPAASNSSAAATQMSRMFINKDTVGERMQQAPGLSMLSKENPFLSQKQQTGGYEDSSRTEFGLVTSDSLLNPSQKSSLMSCRNYGSPSQNLAEPAQTHSSQHSLRHFIDDWPKNQSDRSAVSWPDQLDIQSDRTQLSISIPTASSDFMPSTSSTNNEKLGHSPLRLSRKLDPVPMGLGVGSSFFNEQNMKQANWIPVTWEDSVGGPLGEVLHHTSNHNAAECNNSSVLNLMTGGWDNNSPSSIGSSPTGVLQKTAFGSLSNSSAGSSPRAENRTYEGVSLCNDLLGSNMLNSSSLPAL